MRKSKNHHFDTILSHAKDAPIMYYNPATEAAVRNLEELAEQNRKIIQKLNPPTPQQIVWSSIEGRWINNPELAAV